MNYDMSSYFEDRNLKKHWQNTRVWWKAIPPLILKLMN